MRNRGVYIPGISAPLALEYNANDGSALGVSGRASARRHLVFTDSNTDSDTDSVETVVFTNNPENTRERNETVPEIGDETDQTAKSVNNSVVDNRDAGVRNACDNENSTSSTSVRHEGHVVRDAGAGAGALYGNRVDRGGHDDGDNLNNNKKSVHVHTVHDNDNGAVSSGATTVSGTNTISTVIQKVQGGDDDETDTRGVNPVNHVTANRSVVDATRDAAAGKNDEGTEGDRVLLHLQSVVPHEGMHEDGKIHPDTELQSSMSVSDDSSVDQPNSVLSTTLSSRTRGSRTSAAFQQVLAEFQRRGNTDDTGDGGTNTAANNNSNTDNITARTPQTTARTPSPRSQRNSRSNRTPSPSPSPTNRGTPHSTPIRPRPPTVPTTLPPTKHSRAEDGRRTPTAHSGDNNGQLVLHPTANSNTAAESTTQMEQDETQPGKYSVNEDSMEEKFTAQLMALGDSWKKRFSELDEKVTKQQEHTKQQHAVKMQQVETKCEDKVLQVTQEFQRLKTVLGTVQAENEMLSNKCTKLEEELILEKTNSEGKHGTRCGE